MRKLYYIVIIVFLLTKSFSLLGQSDTLFVSGKIVNVKNESIPFARISIYKVKKRLLRSTKEVLISVYKSDLKGDFKINIPKIKGIELRIGSVGYLLENQKISDLKETETFVLRKKSGCGGNWIQIRVAKDVKGREARIISKNGLIFGRFENHRIELHYPNSQTITREELRQMNR